MAGSVNRIKKSLAKWWDLLEVVGTPEDRFKALTVLVIAADIPWLDIRPKVLANSIFELYNTIKNEERCKEKIYELVYPSSDMSTGYHYIERRYDWIKQIDKIYDFLWISGSADLQANIAQTVERLKEENLLETADLS